MLQTGHLNSAYMNGQGQLKCIIPVSRGTKPIIIMPWDTGEHAVGNAGEDIPELKMQLRIMTAT